MTRYAADTSVSAESSRAEIERTLQRYGADQFAYGWDSNAGALVQFRMNDRQIRFTLSMPDKNEKQFTHTPARGTRRSPAQAYAAWEQATRQKWRALNLVIKAKLEAVESEITEFEDEFMAFIVMPNGQTAGQWITPAIQEAYEQGTMPGALPALGTGD